MSAISWMPRTYGKIIQRRIPKKMSAASCFHKGISRLHAEELLMRARDDGSFLLRDSESLAGAYVLCLLYQSRVHQYRILPDKDGRLFVQSEGSVEAVRFNDIEDLIQGYMVRGDQNGLVCALRKPVPTDRPETGEPESDEEEILDGFCVPSAPYLPEEVASSSDRHVTKTFKYGFLSNFARLDLSCCDGEFVDGIKKYIDSGMEKDSSLYRAGDDMMPEFQQLLEIAGKGLQREMDAFLLKLSLCKDLLTQDEDDRSRNSGLTLNGVAMTYITFLADKLQNCHGQVLKLEEKAHEVVKQLPDSSYDYLDPDEMRELTGALQQMPSPMSSLSIPLSSFEVRSSKAGKFTSKVTLNVDIRQGRFYAVKPSKDFLDSSNTFTHDRILQLVKSTSDNSRLDVIIEGKKKTSYMFENAHARENFCLQIRHMKSLHSKEEKVDQISVFIGTWNMGKSAPDHTLKHWLKCNGEGKSLDRTLSRIPHDIYVIGTQESALNDKDWVNTLKASLKATLMVDVEMLEMCNLWGIRVVVLINPQHRHCISHVQKSSVKTGIANALGNKGASAVSFQFNGTSICFINAHLTSGDERLHRRNQNYRDILKGLSLGPKSFEGFDVSHKFHHVFFFGDLNYRIVEKVDVVLKRAEDRDIPFLLDRDQLRKTQFDKDAFFNFNESEINFMPTYRLYRGKPGYKYDWKKVKKTGERINVPSWCDRVLWHSYPGTFIENNAYGSVENLLNSDHRPVFASFTVGIASQFVHSQAMLTENSSIRILFNRIEAQVRTCVRQHFILEFYSSCLSDIICCESNVKFIESKSSFYCCPEWHADQLPMLRPMFGDRDYLEEQHILIAVRGCDDDDESYGECVVSLKDQFSPDFQCFECVLTHNGEETGKLRGEMRVSMGGKYRVGKSRKTYEIVALDTEYQDPEDIHPSTPRQGGHQPVAMSSSVGIQLPSNGHSSPARQTRYSSDEVLLRLGQESSSPELGWPLNPSNGRQAASPRRKPIMGQSVLQASASQRQVMPVVSTSQLPANIRPSESVPSCLSGVGTAPPVTMPRPAELGRKHDVKMDTPPPPLPKKQRPTSSDKNYDGLAKPTSVQEWLTGLGLEEYIVLFLKSGWDSISRLPNLTAPGLLRMGIQNPAHWNRMITSIQEINFT
ncbi:LOW QUALITY PROTEIN: phosphatidylinositol 3,4,5-trisphosphate 5-phosphatase 2A-like [Haliotis rubra]|uniref:LOW QUALITY PROTEIN: phosphatidylinositol 3,4,5-trisphosphate 5-phosphatase 2A-like n=1 Tax=Haliotis rubra TaxID=36100 RepID=UPI001EE57F9E|nr:LOW QUALITY PROTEIN: phosphatidylinositol 3,4,5-trisphosphate 5-phosphatase 2A-like [Haliotis rubra]